MTNAQYEKILADYGTATIFKITYNDGTQIYSDKYIIDPLIEVDEPDGSKTGLIKITQKSFSGIGKNMNKPFKLLDVGMVQAVEYVGETV